MVQDAGVGTVHAGNDAHRAIGSGSQLLSLSFPVTLLHIDREAAVRVPLESLGAVADRVSVDWVIDQKAGPEIVHGQAPEEPDRRKLPLWKRECVLGFRAVHRPAARILGPLAVEGLLRHVRDDPPSLDTDSAVQISRSHELASP